MTFLDRKKLLEKEKLEVVKVDLGKERFVCVRQMTGRERDRFEKSLVRQVGKGVNITYESATDDFRAKLAVCTVCDEEGNLLLSAADVSVLSQSMSAFTLEKIVNVAQRLNKISEEDKEGLVKNSDAGQAGDSTSDSAKN